MTTLRFYHFNLKMFFIQKLIISLKRPWKNQNPIQVKAVFSVFSKIRFSALNFSNDIIKSFHKS